MLKEFFCLSMHLFCHIFYVCTVNNDKEQINQTSYNYNGFCRFLLNLCIIDPESGCVQAGDVLKKKNL